MKEEPFISSTLLWQDVSLPGQITESELDAVILSEIAQNWLKTARIILWSYKALEKRGIQLDDDIIGARIQELARLGRIESQGNLSMWRHSEVRRASLL